MAARTGEPNEVLAAALLAADPPDREQAARRYAAARGSFERRLRPAERDAWAVLATAALYPVLRELVLARFDLVKSGIERGDLAADASRSVVLQLLGAPGLEPLGAVLTFGGLAALWVVWSGRGALRGTERALAFAAVTLAGLQVGVATTAASLQTGVLAGRLIQGAILGLVVWQGLRLVAWLRDRFDRLDDHCLELSLELARLREQRAPDERP